MGNPFKGIGSHQTGLVYDAVPVTPNNFVDNVGTGNVAIGLYITVSGNVRFLTKDGEDRTITVPNNFYLVCSVKRVMATGTTATGIHALVV
jgi:hypothetical protein